MLWELGQALLEGNQMDPRYGRCGTTSLGRVCCGNAGAPCIRPDGADCCGALRCVNNVCRT